MVRAYSLRVHSDAELVITDFGTHLNLVLRNVITGADTKKTYWKLDTGIDVHEATKIDQMIYFMHHDIGLNVWEDEKDKLKKENENE